MTIIGVMLVATIASAGSGHKGAWIWEDNIAYTKFKHGIVIGIVFTKPSPCDKAALIVSGNNKIAKIGLDVDHTTWDPITALTSPDGSFIELSQSALMHLKNGSNAAVLTDRGVIVMSLDGSAAAINHAWNNCEATQPTPYRRLEPEGVIVTTARSKEVSPNNALTFEEKGGKLLAVENVIFYFGGISEGDDILLKKLVGTMKTENVPFTSLVFIRNPGGNLMAAMGIGDFIRQEGANTAAYELCASACIYAFSAGVMRTSYSDTRFGLHQVSYADGSEGTLIEGQKLAAASYAYLEEKGVHPKIAMWESEIEPDTMRWISQYEAKGLQLVTRIKENYELPVPPPRAATQHSDSSE